MHYRAGGCGAWGRWRELHCAGSKELLSSLNNLKHQINVHCIMFSRKKKDLIETFLSHQRYIKSAFTMLAPMLIFSRI